MNLRSKRTRRVAGRAWAWLAALAAWGGGTAFAQSKPDAGATPARFPTLPPEHVHARALLEGALRYTAPANKLVDPVSGYPFEGWNQDPKRGLFLRSFTQLTGIGLYMEVLANVAAGRAETPHLSRGLALTHLTHLVRTLREDQRDPSLSAEGLLSNFLDLATSKRLGPLASHVQKSHLTDTFGPAKGEALWKALVEIGWLAPRKDGTEADVTRKEEYGDNHFKGPLAPFNDPDTRKKTLAILDARVVMIVFGDNSNLTAAAAKTIGALLDPEVKDRPEAIHVRRELEQFLEDQKPGYARLYDAEGGLFYFGWDATRKRLFGWDDLQGNRTIGHMDYLVNEFRGPATFVAARFGLPTDAIANLGFKMKAYRTGDGRDLYALAPWEGSAFQGLGLGLSLGERDRPSWRALLANMVNVEVDFATRKGLPGFLSESYTGDGTQYTGTVGIPEITVSPRPRITDAASLYPLGVAYSVEPAKVESFLAANWPTVSKLITDHGPWEGYNVARKEPIAFQTSSHTLALVLGLIGRGSDDMNRYLESKGLGGKLAAFFEPGEGTDLLGGPASAFAWTTKGSTVDSGKQGGTFRVKGNDLTQFGIAFVAPDPKGFDLSGGVLTLRYRSAGAIGPVSIDLKPEKSAPGLISRQIFASLDETGSGEGEIRVPLPATPGLMKIKEVVIFHEQPTKGPVDPDRHPPLDQAVGPMSEREGDPPHPGPLPGGEGGRESPLPPGEGGRRPGEGPLRPVSSGDDPATTATSRYQKFSNDRNSIVEINALLVLSWRMTPLDGPPRPPAPGLSAILPETGRPPLAIETTSPTRRGALLSGPCQGPSSPFAKDRAGCGSRSRGPSGSRPSDASWEPPRPRRMKRRGLPRSPGTWRQSSGPGARNATGQARSGRSRWPRSSRPGSVRRIWSRWSRTGGCRRGSRSRGSGRSSVTTVRSPLPRSRLSPDGPRPAPLPATTATWPLLGHSPTGGPWGRPTSSSSRPRTSPSPPRAPTSTGAS